MADARKAKGYTLPIAASMFGFFDEKHLWNCENGLARFPLKHLKRASEIYDIGIDTIIDACILDFTDSIQSFLER